MLKVIKGYIRRLVFYLITPRVTVVYNSYAQAGEDVIMKFLFGSVGISKLTYLELGVHKPDQGNNTYLFYQSGSRGVCVEADVSLIKNIKSAREKDIVLNAGVGTRDEESVDFFIFNEPSLNTMDKAEAEFRVKQGTYKIDKVVKIKLININTIITQNFSSTPHLLSIDIEGMDLPVLKTLDFERYPIPVICVETCTYSENHIKPKDLSVQEYMQTKGYFIYADTYINTIFVNKNWFHSR